MARATAPCNDWRGLDAVPSLASLPVGDTYSLCMAPLAETLCKSVIASVKTISLVLIIIIFCFFVISAPFSP
jgi:hypothetical protein